MEKYFSKLLRENFLNSLERATLTIALNECDGHLIDWCNNVLEYGCQAGTVASLTYHEDTEQFFVDNMNNIFELFNENFIDVDVCPGFRINSNNLAWYGFETTLSKFVNKFAFISSTEKFYEEEK